MNNNETTKRDHNPVNESKRRGSLAKHLFRYGEFLDWMKISKMLFGTIYSAEKLIHFVKGEIHILTQPELDSLEEFAVQKLDYDLLPVHITEREIHTLSAYIEVRRDMVQSLPNLENRIYYDIAAKLGQGMLEKGLIKLNKSQPLPFDEKNFSSYDSFMNVRFEGQVSILGLEQIKLNLK